MSREVIGTDGKIGYRTKLMQDRGQAKRFAKCLAANTRFQDVQIIESLTAKTKSVYVTFRPANPERQADLYLRQYNDRLVRGYREAGNYLFVRDTGFFWCYNLVNGETYEVHPFNCTCPDYIFRCKKAGILCKHCHALQAQSDNDMIERRVDIAA